MRERSFTPATQDATPAWMRREISERLYTAALEAIRARRRHGWPPGIGLYGDALRAITREMQQHNVDSLGAEAFDSVFALVRFHAFDPTPHRL